MIPTSWSLGYWWADIKTITAGKSVFVRDWKRIRH
jgi:hypothetical protein